MNERIKQIRNEYNLTQKEFADKLGTKRNNIAKYETKINEPSEAVISLICKEFGISEEWLRYGTGPMRSEISEDDRFSINLSKLGRTDNEFIINSVNYLAEAAPEHLAAVEDLMKKILGL